jgi:hypothetical protein
MITLHFHSQFSLRMLTACPDYKLKEKPYLLLVFFLSRDLENIFQCGQWWD